MVRAMNSSQWLVLKLFSTCAHACVGHLGNSETHNKYPYLGLRDILFSTAGWSNVDPKQSTSMLAPPILFVSFIC